MLLSSILLMKFTEEVFILKQNFLSKVEKGNVLLLYGIRLIEQFLYLLMIHGKKLTKQWNIGETGLASAHIPNLMKNL